MLNSKTARKS